MSSATAFTSFSLLVHGGSWADKLQVSNLLASCPHPWQLGFFEGARAPEDMGGRVCKMRCCLCLQCTSTRRKTARILHLPRDLSHEPVRLGV